MEIAHVTQFNSQRGPRLMSKLIVGPLYDKLVGILSVYVGGC